MIAADVKPKESSVYLENSIGSFVLSAVSDRIHGYY